MKKFIVDKDDDGIRLDRFFRRHEPQITNAMLNKLLRKKDVRLNGKRAEANSRIATGDEISMSFEVKKIRTLKSEKRESPVTENDIRDFEKYTIFEDKDILVINKPDGLASQGGSGVKISVDDIIKKISDRYKLVHRLDRETSGVMVIAKKTSIAAKISEEIRKRKVEKIYWAIVRGTPKQYEGEIKLKLDKREGKNDKMVVAEDDTKSKTAKAAKTEYKLIENYGGKFSLLELKPITGRMHQLRVHCAAIGHPIIGDGKYGGKEAFEDGLTEQLHLHARRIIIPELGLDVEAPAPKHFQELL